MILNLFNILDTFIFRVFKYSSIIFTRERSILFGISVENQNFYFFEIFFGVSFIGVDSLEKENNRFLNVEHFCDIESRDVASSIR